MAPCRGQRIRTMILNGSLTPDSEMTDVPYVGQYINGKMRQRRIYTIRQFLRYFYNKTPAQRYARITVLLQNPRGNRCVENGVANYHVQDVNRCAYTKLRNVLIQCRRLWRRFGLDEQPSYPANPIPVQSRRTNNAKRCGCYDNRRDCREDPGCQSVRINRQYVCIPRGNARGFKGVGKLSGQITRQEPRRGGYRYDRYGDKYYRRPGPTRPDRNLQTAS